MESVRAMAGPHSHSLIPAALECSICQEMMLHPYCLSCGHTFCGLCLKHWFENRQQGQNDKSCPDCRTTIRAVPVLVHALRELALHVLLALDGADPEKAEQVRQLAAGDPGPEPFASVYFPNPLRDELDAVVRCQNCMWEVQDGECVNCGQVQGEFRGFSDSDSEGIEDLSNEEMNSDDLRFIDDEAVDEDDSDESDAIAHLEQGRWRRAAVQIDSDSDSDGSSKIGSSHQPIVISDSDSSDVMSPDEESEAVMTDEAADAGAYSS